MADIRLAQLPDRTPVRLTLSVSPEVHRCLTDYAAFYRASYGREEPLGDLIVAMIGSFLDSDRGFQQARRAGLTRDG